MTSELTKWFDAITTTCLNVNPRLLDGVNELAKSELLSTLKPVPVATEPLRSDKPLRRQTPRYPNNRQNSIDKNPA